jgi:dTDP-glucose pyrophosphorylase
MIGIMPCAGLGSRFFELGKAYPKCILPYQEKPLLAYNVKWLIDQGCEQIYVVANHQKEKISEVAKDYNLPVNIIAPKNNQGLSISIQSALEKQDDTSVMIMLGDMIVHDSPGEEEFNWVSTSKVKDWSRWCMFDPRKNAFLEKPEEQPDTNKALTGVYFLTSSKELSSAINEQILQDIKINGEYTISSALTLMGCEFKTKNLQVLDFGSVEKYFKNKGIKKGRDFNSIQFIDNTVVKKSRQNQKIIDEINWYQNIPTILKSRTPKLLDYDMYSEESSYVMQKINSPSVRELYLFFDRSIDLWNKILGACKNVYMQMIKYEYNYSSFDFILEKTKSRSKDFEVKSFLKDFEKVGRKIETTTHLIHGDFIPANMFWNSVNEDIIMIDPRGQMLGSKYYDWAKMKHSFNYHYDFIDAELYTLNKGSVKMFNDGCEKIERLFDKLEAEIFSEEERLYLKFLTASLFLSEVPLHSHNQINQRLLYDVYEKIYTDAKT